MKKLTTSALALSILLTAPTADAASIKPSDLKKEVKSYEAVITKNLKYVDNKDFKVGTLKKGTKITIVERVNYYGYDFLYLKGDTVVSLRDDSIKILKEVPGKYVYTEFVLPKKVQEKIDKVSKSNPDYKAYAKAGYNYEKTYYEYALPFNEMFYVRLLVIPFVIAVGWGRPPFPEYKQWVKDGKPEMKGNPDPTVLKCSVDSKGPNIDILSKEFYADYFMTNNRTVAGYKKGVLPEETPRTYPGCSFIGTPTGMAMRFKDVSLGVKSLYEQYERRGEVYVTPVKKYTYEQVIKAYGKPDKTKFSGNARVEEQLIYDGPATKGWKVIVGLDGKKGNVKYLYKVND